MSGPVSEREEFTVDELAARAGMTVRNVRAYAARGLIEAPRLEGRTGYYSQAHLRRLHLVRTLLERGYTLAAVEKSLRGVPSDVAGHALDLIDLVHPSADEAEETMSRDSLAALAGVDRDDALIDALAEHGLVAWVDGDRDRVRLLEPSVVRAGAAAVAIGLPVRTVVGMLPALRDHTRAIADTFVRDVSAEVVQPFLDAGTPADDWPRVLATIESLLPIASQVTLGVFRTQFREAIEAEIGETLGALAEGSTA